MKIRDLRYAVLSGLLLASSFPPFRFEAFIWMSLVPLLWSFDRKHPHEAFALGFLSGFIAYGIIIWWVKVAMINFGGLAPWLAWFVTALLVAYMALYIGLFGYFLVRLFPNGGFSRLMLAAPLWVTLEMIRAYVLSGFPWALIGYSQYRILPVVQIADLVGVYGISFFILAVNASIWHFFRYPQKAPFVVVGGIAGLAAIVVGYGYLRLFEVPTEAGPKIRPAGIVQGNTDQLIKWNPKYREAIVKNHEGLTMVLSEEFRKGQHAVPPLIVWPEAAAPLFFEEEPFWQKRMSEIARRSEAYLLFGALRVDRSNSSLKFFNSAYLLGPDGSEVGRYDKIHLVPFGEYVPLGPLLFFVKKLVPVLGTTVPGEEAKVFHIPGGSFGVLICFEAIFPRVVRQFKTAQFLVNITNDAWYGHTAASEQHLSMVTLRAVEHRVPIVRAANTGISAIIDARGAILRRSPLFRPWHHLDSIAPRTRSLTLYAKMGDVFAFTCALIVLFAIPAVWRRPRVRVYD